VTLVVDASMAIAWLFADERSATPQEVLRQVAAEGAYAPSLWKLEVANVLRGAVRRKRCDAKYAARSLQRLERLQITIDAETDTHAWGRTRQLSEKYDLTMYDAAYLELAIRRVGSLASRDAALAAAARKAGLEVLGA